MKSQTKISLFTTLDVTTKDLKYVKINGVNPLYLIFSKVNRYFEDIDKGKYLILVPANKSNKKICKICKTL